MFHVRITSQSQICAIGTHPHKPSFLRRGYRNENTLVTVYQPPGNESDFGKTPSAAYAGAYRRQSPLPERPPSPQDTTNRNFRQPRRDHLRTSNQPRGDVGRLASAKAVPGIQGGALGHHGQIWPTITPRLAPDMTAMPTIPLSPSSSSSCRGSLIAARRRSGHPCARSTIISNGTPSGGSNRPRDASRLRIMSLTPGLSQIFSDKRPRYTRKRELMIARSARCNPGNQQ